MKWLWLASAGASVFAVVMFYDEGWTEAAHFFSVVCGYNIAGFVGTWKGYRHV